MVRVFLCIQLTLKINDMVLRIHTEYRNDFRKAQNFEMNLNNAGNYPS